MLEKDLTRMASDPDTWETLYFCNRDNSYWLLSYEHPEMQGGGVKVLNEIREEDAIALSKKLKQ